MQERRWNRRNYVRINVVNYFVRTSRNPPLTNFEVCVLRFVLIGIGLSESFVVMQNMHKLNWNKFISIRIMV